MQPTDEQIKVLWKRCGFKFASLASYQQFEDYKEHEVFYYPNGITAYQLHYLPVIDLSNLFKWAVPKLLEGLDKMDRNKVYLMLCKVMRDFIDGKDLELALFWAVYPLVVKKE